MHPAGFEPTIPASELLRNHALDHAATYNLGCLYIYVHTYLLTYQFFVYTYVRTADE